MAGQTVDPLLSNQIVPPAGRCTPEIVCNVVVLPAAASCRRSRRAPSPCRRGRLRPGAHRHQEGVRVGRHRFRQVRPGPMILRLAPTAFRVRMVTSRDAVSGQARWTFGFPRAVNELLLGSENQLRPSRSHYRAGTLAGRSPSISSRGFRGQGVEREGRSGRPPTGDNGIYDLTYIEVAGSAGDGDLATSAAGSPISSPRRSTFLAGTPRGTRRATPPVQRRFCDRRPELLPPTTAGRPRHRHRIPLRPEEVQCSPGVRPGAAGPTESQPAAMLRTTWAPVASVYRTVGFTDNESPPPPPPTVPRRLRNLGLGCSARSPTSPNAGVLAVTASQGGPPTRTKPKPAGRCVPTQPGRTQINERKTMTRGRQ